MSACIPGREVVVRLRQRTTGYVIHRSVVCPATWKKGRLLAYVRREHPEQTVVISAWGPVTADGFGWAPRLWIVNPEEMANS